MPIDANEAARFLSSAGFIGVVDVCLSDPGTTPLSKFAGIIKSDLFRLANCEEDRSMNTRKIALGVVTAVILYLGVNVSASALSPNTIGKFFFDENGQLVGQSVDTCTGQQFNGGNTHTAYFVMTQVSCGIGGCKLNPKDWRCPWPEPIVPGTYIVEYTLPGFENVQSACAQMEGQCHVPPYRIMNLGWTWN